MALNYVTLVLDLYDGGGSPVTKGAAALVPSAVLTDAADQVIITQDPVPGVFHPSGFPQVTLLATDNSAPRPAGWTWGITFTGITGAPSPFSFFLAYANGTTQYLSSLIPVSTGSTFQAYLPLPAGTAAAGQVPVATGSGTASRWAYAPVDWINAVTQYGADPAGSADSTSAIQNAINALPATGGAVYLPAGTYKVSSTLTMANLLYAYVRGDGRWATTIKFTGAGDCLRVYNTDTTGVLTGGGILDLAIDGTSAAAGSTGLHYGDQRLGELRIAVSNFSGAGSIGVHFDNQYSWTERCFGYLRLTNDTQHIVFDVSAPAGGSYTATNASPCVFTCASPTFSNGNQVVLSGGSPPTGFSNGTGYFVVNASGTTFQLAATSGGSAINSTSTGSGTVTLATSQNSFGYSNFDVELVAKANQDGIVLQNGALYYNSRLALKGNFTGSSSAQSNAVLRVTGTVPAGHVAAGNGSALNSTRLDLQAECVPGTGSNVPQTINFGTLGTNKILGCTGIIDFAQGARAFAVTNWGPLTSAGTFIYDGVIRGDFNLNNATVGLGTAYSMVCTGVRTYAKSLLASNNGNLFVDSGDFFNQTLTQSITISLNPAGASTLGGAQRKTIIITQAASGGPYTVTWPSTGSPSTTSCTVVWPGGVAPVMSAAAGAVDVYYLDTYDGATWYGQAVQAMTSGGGSAVDTYFQRVFAV